MISLITELHTRFGKDWMNAQIEEKDYPFEKYRMDNMHNNNNAIIDFDINQIWNRNGLIYSDGEWATKKIDELPEKYCYENKNGIYKFNSGHSIEGTHDKLDNEEYQYLTEWQYNELINAPKVGDIGLFWRDDMKSISVLTKIDFDNGYYDLAEEPWENFNKLENIENVNLNDVFNRKM